MPHRELRRAQRRRDFTVLLAGVAMLAACVVFAGGALLQRQVDAQESRNAFIRAENQRLDNELKAIATLRKEIEDLKARKTAVESLQANRNEPVQMLEELARHTPEGVFLRSVKQQGRVITLVGVAQSNERVSDYLRRLSNDAKLLGNPVLIEIKAGSLGTGRDARRVYDFSLSASLKGNDATDKPAATAKKG
jgi:type IV pilus assembly protein PilN